MSSDSQQNFGAKDPIRALYMAYQTSGAADRTFHPPPPGQPHSHEHEGEHSLAEELAHEIHGQAVWTLFFHSSIAERLKLNPTDQKCLDIIWRCFDSDVQGACMTPGQLARETKLTTGAVTGVLDRLEQAGYVRREHDPEDRRRIIVRPIPERIKADVRPLFEWMSTEFEKLCAQYSDDELRRMIDFARRSQQLLQQATDHLREME